MHPGKFEGLLWLPGHPCAHGACSVKRRERCAPVELLACFRSRPITSREYWFELGSPLPGEQPAALDGVGRFSSSKACPTTINPAPRSPAIWAIDAASNVRETCSSTVKGFAIVPVGSLMAMPSRFSPGSIAMTTADFKIVSSTRFNPLLIRILHLYEMAATGRRGHHCGVMLN